MYCMYLAECVCIDAPSNFWGKKYKQIHTIQTNTYIIHTPIFTNTYKNTYKISQLLCVSMCIYVHVFHVYACIMSAWLYFMHPKTWSDVHVVCACICLYLHVSTDCHCSQWFYVCNWATLRLIEHHGLSASGAVIEEGLNQGTLACIYWHEISRYMQILTWYQQIHAIQTHTYIGQPAKIDLSWLGPEHLGNVFLPGILTGISGGNAYWQIHAHTYNTCLYIHIVTK